MSVGANWLHHLVSKTQFLDEKDLTVEKRLWSWLVICDDSRFALEIGVNFADTRETPLYLSMSRIIWQL